MADRAIGNGIVDLRSDTVTRPTQAMREAMAVAEVGDDVYGEDPTVTAFQAEVASLFGHEAALFAPSGSMSNQIALRLLAGPGEEILCDAEAHIITYELGAAAALSGISTRTWSPCGGDLETDVIAEMIWPAGYSTLATKAIAVEQTHNRAGGAIIDLDRLRRLRAVADSAGIALHCDGARIWNAHIAAGVPLADYGQLFDTLSVCLSKGLGAPIGSLVISTAERIAQARVIRKRLGGGMRQVGILAAAGRYALHHHLAGLADDHARARRLALALAPWGIVDPARVQTNIVPLDLRGTTLDSAQLVEAAGEQGVLVSAVAPRRARLLTHLDVDDRGIDRALDVFKEIFASRPVFRTYD